MSLITTNELKELTKIGLKGGTKKMATKKSKPAIDKAATAQKKDIAERTKWHKGEKWRTYQGKELQDAAAQSSNMLERGTPKTHTSGGNPVTPRPARMSAHAASPMSQQKALDDELSRNYGGGGVLNISNKQKLEQKKPKK